MNQTRAAEVSATLGPGRVPRGEDRRRAAQQTNDSLEWKRVVYLIIMFSVAAVGIGTLWLQQKRERSHLESSEKFLSSLQKISPDVKPIQRRPGRRPVAQGTRRTAPSRTPGRRPTRSEVARREAARRRVEARRRSQTVATRSRAAS